MTVSRARGVRAADPRIAQLLEILDRGYERRSWHGTNLRGSIRGLTIAQAAWRPARDRHNIWEIVVHAAYWKYTVWRRLVGERRGTFELEGSNWFLRPEEMTAAAWKDDIALLARTHRGLRDAAAGFPPDALSRKLPGSAVTAFELIAGIAAHDLYHAGQIQLLKRLFRERR
jgi:DinB family protein